MGLTLPPVFPGLRRPGSKRPRKFMGLARHAEVLADLEGAGVEVVDRLEVAHHRAHVAAPRGGGRADEMSHRVWPGCTVTTRVCSGWSLAVETEAA